VRIEYYLLKAPGDAHDIEQGSGLHYGRLGEREGLWVVCDRNGGRSAGRLFFIRAEVLKKAIHGQELVADEAFSIIPPQAGWPAFAAAHPAVSATVLEDLQHRIRTGIQDDGGPRLDLEAVTIGPSPEPPHEPHVFVVAEEPFSSVLELALEGGGPEGRARLVAVYAYQEAENEHGSDFNDGLEGLAWGGADNTFYLAEEGTRFHDGPPGPRLFFLEPRLSKGELQAGQVRVDRVVSDGLTAAVRSQRKGPMQTLNALAIAPNGQLLAVDRNGGWILRIAPHAREATRWLNLYDLRNINLRETLDDFPGPRHMPYISIEGIALDPTGALWLVDDPAMPEAFRASALIRITGLDLGG
jgi:hypothetical protein